MSEPMLDPELTPWSQRIELPKAGDRIRVAGTEMIVILAEARAGKLVVACIDPKKLEPTIRAATVNRSRAARAGAVYVVVHNA